MKDVLEHNVETLIERGGEPPQISPDARARIKNDLVTRFGAPVAASRTRVRRPAIAVACGLAALAAAAMLVVRGQASGPATTTPALTKLADGTTYVAERGARVDVLGPRRVRVTGAVLFDVVPGKGQFVVETAHGRVEVLGTKFVVDGEPGETSAAVIRGEVKLASAGGDVTLHAGEQGVAEPGKPPVRGPAPRLSHLVSWSREARGGNDVAVHHGTLFARDPGVRSHPPWGDEYPLPIKQLTLDVVVEDQVARVALDQTFHNNQPQDLEGVYRFAIPSDAALQRLAMYVDGQLEESAVVERMAARRIYEELVYRRVDPALLEWAGTGRLSLRVYPIPANDDKRLVLAYTQSLPKLYDDYTLTIPLPEVDQPVGQLDATVRVKGCANCELVSPSHTIDVERAGDDAVVHYHRVADKLGDSFILHVRDPRHAPTITTKTDGSDDYVMVRATPTLARAALAYRPRTWVILDDVSASRGTDELHAQRDLIDALVRELDENDRVSVVAFDVAARVMLPPTRTLDVDRRALRAGLDREGGVGATDFQVGLDAALQQLTGVAGDDAMIVYVGDGVITAGPRNLDALRAQIAGKAHFVGVGVGDGPDTQTLGALAAATRGYTTTLDLADDLGWRAFDLVAALHTARVTNVSARLVDARGNTVPATSYLGAPQLADGEELELVAKLARGATPAAVELDGTQDGAPWHQRIELGAARGDAGYLPRLWAQRHIAARLLAKHEPVAVPACAGEPCLSEADVREARDEQIRREVVALGKRYFLLSRHTSLLVLENDAMYAQYGVTKGAGDTWAPYALPARIAAAPARPVVTAPIDAEVIRAPEEPAFFETQGQGWMSFRERRMLGRDFESGAPGVTRDAEVTKDRLPELRMHRAANNDDVMTMLPAQATTPMQLDEGKMGKRDASDIEGGLLGKVVDPNDLTIAAGDYGFGRGGYGAGGGGYGTLVGRDKSSASNEGYFANGVSEIGGDVTAFVPALFPDEVDGVRAQRAGTGSIEPAAQQLLAQARAALAAGVYRWGDRELAVDARHSLAWRRTTDDDLVEVAAYDGAMWTRRYGELGLSVTRAMPDDDVALALAAAPLWIAEPAHYAKYFDVTAKGRDVVLSRAKRVAYVLSFDAQAHLVAVHDHDGRELVAITWSATGPVAARSNGEPIAVAFSPPQIADAAAWAFAGTQPGVVVTLPAHAAPFWQERVAHAAQGSPAWRDAERQLLVSAAAAHDAVLARATFDALRAHGGVELGDVVLASGGIAAIATRADREAALGVFAEQPIGRFLVSLRGTAQAANVAEPGLLGALVQAHAALDAVRAGKRDAATTALGALAGRAVALRLLVARAASARTTPSLVVDLWDACATGRFANTARESEVEQLLWSGREAAADAFARVVDHLDLTAPPPARLASYQYLFTQAGRGNVAWEAVYARWRDKVLAGDSFAHVMALLPIAATRDDLGPVFAKAVALAGTDRARALDVARLALAYGQVTWADRIVQPMLGASATHAVYELAARTALAVSRYDDALADLEHAQDVPDDTAVSIDEARGELRTIMALCEQLAASSQGPAREQLVAKALHWGERARAVAPGGDVDIDRELGGLLLAVGDRAGAWRQLSTAIERDPWSSAGYTLVAATYERQGRLEDALPFWQQAIVIDQTNPTPRLRKAQALLALGRKQDADELLRQIAGRKWHDVWSNVVEQARELRHK